MVFLVFQQEATVACETGDGCTHLQSWYTYNVILKGFSSVFYNTPSLTYGMVKMFSTKQYGLPFKNSESHRYLINVLQQALISQNLLFLLWF